eukprot:12412588-Karenia_brevis.AAC.1
MVPSESLMLTLPPDMVVSCLSYMRCIISTIWSLGWMILWWLNFSIVLAHSNLSIVQGAAQRGPR